VGGTAILGKNERGDGVIGRNEGDVGWDVEFCLEEVVGGGSP